MVDPFSVKCPHCTASIKIKSRSVIGKKAKCPKCETPFVIPEPAGSKAAKSKQKPKVTAVEEDDFLDDEFDDYEDDFDDWEDDLDEGPAVTARPSKKKSAPPKKERKRESSFKLSDYGFSPFLTFIFAFLMLSNLFCFFMQSRLIMLSFICTILFAIGCLLAGGIGLLVEAAKESGTELVLCLLVPFYNIYFGISRFEYTKNAVAAFGMGVVLIASSVLMLMGGIFAVAQRANFNHQMSQAQPMPAMPSGNDVFKNRNNNSSPSPVNRAERMASRTTRVKPSTTPTKPSSSIQSKEKTVLAPTKFDLSQLEPLLLTWPIEGASGSEVYSERKTDSIGKVFAGSNTFRAKAGENPPGSSMDFRVYLPPNAGPENPVPCVLVPPAGSNLLSGMEIDPEDLIPNPEHEPYLKAGFAVITFSLDGPLRNRENSNIFQLKAAYEDFQDSKAGLVNCMRALMEVQAVIPGIDKNNIFIAGHSSAGTLSLLFAEHVPDQLRGCLAYAPSVDLEKSFQPHIAEIKPILSGVEDFIKKTSPQTHISDLTCPVFLFHTPDDPVTSYANAKKFADQLKLQGTEVEFVTGSGADHFQPMVDEGIPKGIEWMKKIVANSKSSGSEPKMASSGGMSNKSAMSRHLTLHKATFKVVGLDSFYTDALKSNRDFWAKSLVEKTETGLESILTGFSQGTVRLDLDKMLFSFEYHGDLPDDFAKEFAEHIFTKDVIIEKDPISVETVKFDPNSHFSAGNFLTFRLRTVNRIRFNIATSPQIIETRLRLIDRYVPDSLVVNLNEKWAYIKLKGVGNLDTVKRDAERAFSDGGLFVNAERIDLTEADLKGSASGGNTATTSGTPDTGSSPAMSDTKQKFIIRYGIYGGDKIKESVKRSLKGFVWVDPATVKFNPDAREISFINSSPVDQAALERALARNKFFQVNITSEAAPAETEPKEKAADEKENAKAGSE